MKWNLTSISKETDHRFLNLYTLHYEIVKDGSLRPYDYFMASRKEAEELRPCTHSYARPDGVLIALYRVNPDTQETEIVLTTQFRPAIGTYVTSMPAGLLDPEDDDLFVAAAREAKEEAGIVASHFELLCPAGPTSSGLSDEMNAVVLGHIDKRDETSLEEYEDIKTEIIPLSELRRRLSDPHYLFPVNIRLIALLLIERFKK